MRRPTLAITTCLLAVTTLLACNTGDTGNNGNTTHQLAGQWLPADYLRQVAENHSIAHTSAPVYGWVALSFNREEKDSVLTFNGFEAPDAVPFSTEGDSLKLDLPSRVYLHKNPIDSNSITAVEYADGQVFKQHYERAPQPLPTPEATFDRELRKALFGNKQYRILSNQGKPATDTTASVIFKEDGQVTGLPGFAFYDLCYAGDCIQTADTSDILFLSPDNRKQQRTVFHYAMSTDGNKLALYTQDLVNPNEKGAARKGKLLYELSAR